MEEWKVSWEDEVSVRIECFSFKFVGLEELGEILRRLGEGGCFN